MCSAGPVTLRPLCLSQVSIVSHVEYSCLWLLFHRWTDGEMGPSEAHGGEGVWLPTPILVQGSFNLIRKTYMNCSHCFTESPQGDNFDEIYNNYSNSSCSAQNMTFENLHTFHNIKYRWTRFMEETEILHKTCFFLFFFPEDLSGAIRFQGCCKFSLLSVLCCVFRQLFCNLKLPTK